MITQLHPQLVRAGLDAERSGERKPSVGISAVVRRKGWLVGVLRLALVIGVEVFGALLGSYSGNWSYEMNGFGLLFAAPHVPLAMAATLELARDCLRPLNLSISRVIKVGVLATLVALLHPFHAPVLLGAAGLAGLI